MTILSYWFTFFLSSYNGELDSEEIEESLSGKFDATWQVVKPDDKDRFIVLTIWPVPVCELFVDCPNRKNSISQTEYELWFAEFLEANGQILKKIGFDCFTLHMEIFYVKEQICYFHVFSPEVLSRISKFDVDICITTIPESREYMEDRINYSEKVE